MKKNSVVMENYLHDRWFWIAAGAAFAYVMVLYISTLAATVTFWDAGEFIATSYILGIPHPPGTPLFVLIGRVWSLIPFPVSVPYKLNLLSAFATALSAMILFVVVVKTLWKPVTRDVGGTPRMIVYGGAFSAAVVSASALTVWQNAIETEVYAVSFLMVAVLTWLLLRWRERRGTPEEKAILLLMAYIAGLSVGNHLTTLLAGPGIFLVFLLTAKSVEFERYLSLVVGVFAFTLLVFLGIDLEQLGAGRFFEDFSLLFSEVIVGPLFVLLLVLFSGTAYWMHKTGMLRLFGLLLLFFTLALSVHLYLPIRASLDPSINEADPTTWSSFWDVLLRKQYGSRPPFPRTVDFFQYQLPLYFIYFFEQYGNLGVSYLFLALGLIGIVAHIGFDRRSFWHFLAVYLAFSVGLVFLLNFKLGHTQALDQFPGQEMHEVRERDYFFQVSFAFFGVWVGMGLAHIVRGMRKALAGTGSRPPVIFYPAAGLVFMTSFIPSVLNHHESDHSENYIAWDYAYDILISAEPYGVIFTNGDNDTFPLWFLQEVEGVRKDVLVANLSLINTPWYIKQLRDWEPPPSEDFSPDLVELWRSMNIEIPEEPPGPIVTYSDEEIESLVPIQIGSDRAFRVDSLVVTYGKDTIFRVQDLMVLHLLKANDWERPMYFAVTVSTENKIQLDEYFLMQGLLYKILPVRAQELAARDPGIGHIPEAGVYIDIDRSEMLLNTVFSYRSIFDPEVYKDPNTKKLLNNFAAAYSFLGRAYIGKNEMEKAIASYKKAKQFAQNPDRFDYLISTLYAQTGDYTRADSFLGQYMNRVDRKGTADPGLYLQRAALAFSEGDTQQAINYLEESVRVDPEYETGYRQLFRFYDALGKEKEAEDVLERWLTHFPGDTLVEQQLKSYGQN